MKRNVLSEVLLYRYRYIIGYALFAIVLVGALYMSFLIPGQITAAEKQSAITSATLSLHDPSIKDIVNLPYHLLQKASLHYFGITNLGIKLPSLIIGALSAIGLLWLLRRWLLRDSIAIFTICIFVAHKQFLSTSQEGVPLIMMIFWLIFVLLFALKFTANNKSIIWGVLLTSSLVLSLYTPLSIYVFICLLAASILHPHLRYVVSTVPKLNMTLFIALGALLAAPLVYTFFKDPAIIATLAGWPGTSVTLELLRHNIKEILKALFFFWQPQLTTVGLTPIFGASSFVLIVFGALSLIRDHHSARSYMLLMTLPILILPSIFNPELLIILSVPLLLLFGLGVETLLDEWYKLFPHNPYARVTALVPMIILLAGIMIGNLLFYMNGYRYSPDLSHYYSYDLSLARQTLQAHPSATLVTSEQQKPFYMLLKRDFPDINITSEPSEALNAQTVVVYREPANQYGALKYLSVDSYANNGVRFYVYQK
ncbi:MAG: hypothetical protein Q7T74_05005 [Candidatus Saccharibacteria bacterium]|nr:hypothetical protein [Candidatus Saccharibacteria bacterium]